MKANEQTVIANDHGLDENGVNAIYAQIFAANEKFLYTILDLVHARMREFYEYAGRP